MQLTKRREIKAKLELASRIDKIDGAQKEIVEWEAKVQRCQQEFELISQEIKKEMERFEVKRINELKSIIIKYLEDQMAHQQQVSVSQHFTKVKMNEIVEFKITFHLFISAY